MRHTGGSLSIERKCKPRLGAEGTESHTLVAETQSRTSIALSWGWGGKEWVMAQMAQNLTPLTGI